ncbi:10656_t:CDS:2 [Ambispora gerdemannii]|uniref:10656_t:CDS:1 n=1 Tax=Ambispora gerdemannii TaxID=144530 RepID=A0A9N8UZ24_9GLOM|nr:10656_t:CDS:2 [Ambispora gerdemannii]
MTNNLKLNPVLPKSYAPPPAPSPSLAQTSNTFSANTTNNTKNHFHDNGYNHVNSYINRWRGRGGGVGIGVRGRGVYGGARGKFNNSPNYRGGRQAYNNNGYESYSGQTDNSVQSGEQIINFIPTEPQLKQESSNDSPIPNSIPQFNIHQDFLQTTNSFHPNLYPVSSSPNQQFSVGQSSITTPQTSTFPYVQLTDTSQSRFKASNTGFNVNRPSKLHFERVTQPRIKMKLETPEEIAKWIEERKKRYPTDANIAKKKQQEAERIARGEMITKTNAKLRDKRLGNSEWGTGNKQKKPRLNQNHRPENFDDIRLGADILIAAASAAPFGRETNLSEEYISQNAKIEELDDSSKLKGNDNDNVQTFIGHNKKFAHLKKTICIHYKNGHCKHGNKCRYIHERPGKESQSKHEAKSRQSGNLLRMLIEKEIQKERNILLQSIRYIVDKNFFQIVSNDSLEAAKRRKGPAIEELQND